MRRLSVLVLVVAVDALAWESECRDPVAASQPRDSAAIAASVCRGTSGGFCDPGLPFARGSQLGEHTFITRLAMRWANLPPTMVDDNQVLKYWTDGQNAPGTSTPSIEPAPTGKMSRQLTRVLSLAELAQLHDGSHSFADFIAGNEHCPLWFDELHRDADGNTACHAFRAHMGATNSAHFGSQVKQMYLLYHRVAVETASRCKQLSDAFATAGGHPAIGAMNDALDACELEALAFESVASHFLADAFSTGHQWERWGSPLHPRTDEAFLRAHMLAATSGMIHGWRAIARDVDVYLQPLTEEHDQLSMPGAFDDEPDASVRSVYAGAKGLRSGGGDLYALQCLAPREGAHVLPFADGAYTTLGPDDGSRPLSFQYRRMMTCLGQSFREVYSFGPMRLRQGALPQWGVPESQLDPEVLGMPVPSNPACFGHRVTNASMVLGMRAGQVRFDQPGFTAKTAADLLPIAAGVRGDVGFHRKLQALLPRLNSRMRPELTRLAANFAIRAARDPDGTGLSKMEFAENRELLGFARNQDGEALVGSDGVPYLERKSKLTWSDAPYDRASLTCADDLECLASADGGRGGYCDRQAYDPRDGGFAPRCMPVEAPLLRAFRTAELVYWCQNDDWARLTAARRACRGKPASSPECVACVEVHLPHVRNACDPGEGFVGIADGVERRSACDVVADAGLASFVYSRTTVHLPYAPVGLETPAEALRRATMTACQTADSELNQNPHAYGFTDAGVPVMGLPGFSRSGTAALCGLIPGGEHWLRVRANSSFDLHAWKLTLTTQKVGPWAFKAPTTDVELQFLAGPSCTQVLGTATGGVDVDGDGSPEELSLTWNAQNVGDELCIRVRATNPTTRTAYGYTLAAP
ncbi:MAG: hypothetical protein JNK82_30650 [Myxococcaceae bacterium]|nr:hypothetical protein [Myxococcaceae bacterium]